jgi:hypothetical protein
LGFAWSNRVAQVTCEKKEGKRDEKEKGKMIVDMGSREISPLGRYLSLPSPSSRSPTVSNLGDFS